jgi:hypothetical protein
LGSVYFVCRRCWIIHSASMFLPCNSVIILGIRCDGYSLRYKYLKQQECGASEVSYCNNMSCKNKVNVGQS